MMKPESANVALVRMLASGIAVSLTKPFIKRGYMPDDEVVVLNRDPDEAGDYRVMKHSDAVNNPDWTICPDIEPKDLD